MEYLELIASRAWSLFWIPIAVWTALAGVVLLALRAIPESYLRLHRDVLTALLVALPLGLALGPALPGPAPQADAPVEVVVTPNLDGSLADTAPLTAGSGAWVSAGGLAGILTLIALVAGLLALILHSERARTLRELIRRSRSWTGPRPTMDLAGIDIRVAGGMRVPFSAGVTRPCIVLPRTGPPDARLAIAHEAIHHFEGDVARMRLARWIAAAFVWHPMVHVILARLDLRVEMLCDRLVLTRTRSTAPDYARVLLAYVPGPFPRHAVSMGRSHTELKQRIAAMNATQRGSRTASLTLSVLLLTLVSVAVGCSQGDPAIDLDADNTYDVAGIVTDRATGEPVAGANVMLSGTRMGSATGPDGSYMIRGVPAGRYDLRISYVGREPIMQSVTVPGSGTALRRAELGEAPIEIFLDQEGNARLYGKVIPFRELSAFLANLNEKAVVTLRIHPDAPMEAANLATRTIRQAGEQGSNFRFGVGAMKTAPSVPSVSRDDDDVFIIVEQMPELQGGLAAVQAQINYPTIAKKAGIEGRVIVQFVVDEQGHVTNSKVVRGIGAGCDEEALRAVETMRFTPGRQRGQAVKVKMSLPVTFRITESEPFTRTYRSDGSVESTPLRVEGAVRVGS